MNILKSVLNFFLRKNKKAIVIESIDITETELNQLIYKIELEIIKSLYIEIRSAEIAENIDNNRNSIEEMKREIINLKIERTRSEIESLAQKLETNEFITKRRRNTLEKLKKKKKAELKNLLEQKEIYFFITISLLYR
jgi:hypothetical protein